MIRSRRAAPPRAPEFDRLIALDGLRGLAALTVVLAHFTLRWSSEMNGESLYPYGDRFVDFWLPIADLLLFGVNLFFVVSGFVMVKMLARSTGLCDFMLRRIARLWPMLFLCATATTLIINLSGFPLRFETTHYWEVTPFEYLSSIFFIDPAFLGPFFGRPWASWVDGVYWTLWIDVRFYVLVAAVYWIWSGPRQFARAWVCVQLASLGLLMIALFTPLQLPKLLELILQPQYLAWFTVGIAAAYLVDDPDSSEGRWLALSAAGSMLFAALVSSTFIPDKDWFDILVLYILVLMPFLLIVMNTPGIMSIFTHPIAVVIGMASYPLYIFHEASGVVVMNLLADAGVPVSLILPLMLALAVTVAMLLHKIFEKSARRVILQIGQPGVVWSERAFPNLRFKREEKTLNNTEVQRALITQADKPARGKT